MARFTRSSVDMPHEQDVGTATDGGRTDEPTDGPRPAKVEDFFADKPSENWYLYEVDGSGLSKRFV